MSFTSRNLRGWFHIFTSQPLVHTSSQTFEVASLTWLLSDLRTLIPDSQISGICIHAFADLRIWGLAGSWLLIFASSRLLIFAGSRLLIFAGSRPSFFTGSWLQIFAGSRLPIFVGSWFKISVDFNLPEIDSRFTRRKPDLAVVFAHHPKAYLMNFDKSDPSRV
jgi:hypothetical protein